MLSVTAARVGRCLLLLMMVSMILSMPPGGGQENLQKKIYSSKCNMLNLTKMFVCLLTDFSENPINRFTCKL